MGTHKSEAEEFDPGPVPEQVEPDGPLKAEDEPDTPLDLADDTGEEEETEDRPRFAVYDKTAQRFLGATYPTEEEAEEAREGYGTGGHEFETRQV